MDGARDLIVALKDAGRSVILASSATEEEVEHYVDLLDVRDIVDGWTTSSDVEKTKPHPDLVTAAMEKTEGDSSILVGDTTWDCKAARRAGIDTVAVLTGGFSEQELTDAGAIHVFPSVRELLERFSPAPDLPRGRENTNARRPPRAVWSGSGLT